MITNSILLMYLFGLLVGLIAGFVMHRSDYCLAGMFRNAILFRNTFMLRILFLQIIFTTILFEIVRLLGFLPLYPFPILSAPSPANLIGGFVFGIGMVLAGGCVVGTLYKMGSGSIISLVAFVGLICGSGLYAEIHPWWGPFVKGTTFFKGFITLPQLLDIDPFLFVVSFVLPSLAIIRIWYRQNKWERPAEVKGYIQPWKTAVILALLGLASYIALGMPLGVSTTYAKLAAMIGSIFSPNYVSSLQYFKVVPLDVVHPFTGVTLTGRPGPEIDTIWLIQFPVIVGIILGSSISAMLLKEFSYYCQIPRKQIITAFVGGVILGLASRMAPSCNVWHLFGGIPLFAMQSLLFVLGLVPGTWLGGKILLRILNNNAVRA